MVRVSPLPLFFVALIGIMLCTNLSFGIIINCSGRAECLKIGTDGIDRIASKLCNDVPPNNIFKPSVRIATVCKAGVEIGAFVQSSTQSVTGAQACQLIRRLQEHNCKFCGSVQLDPNDPSKGQFTVDFLKTCG